jgi:mono/diheme cytochrome c family protein
VKTSGTRMVTALMAAGVLALATAGRVQAADEAAVKRGMEVYASATPKCSMCHSIEGKGNKKYPLDGVGSKLSAADIREWIVNPPVMIEKSKSTAKPAMKAYSKLPKADVDALVAYMESLKKK